MKWLLLFSVVFCAFFEIKAQDQNDLKFIFAKPFEEVDYSSITEDYFYNPPLGETVAKGMEVIKNEYTYKPEPTPLYPNPGLEVEKPAIFYSAKKLYSHYKKQVKKGEVDLETAQQKMNEIIKICVNIRHLDTTDFETALKNSKEPEDLDIIFAKVEYEK